MPRSWPRVIKFELYPWFIPFTALGYEIWENSGKSMFYISPRDFIIHCLEKNFNDMITNLSLRSLYTLYCAKGFRCLHSLNPTTTHFTGKETDAHRDKQTCTYAVHGRKYGMGLQFSESRLVFCFQKTLVTTWSTWRMVCNSEDYTLLFMRAHSDCYRGLRFQNKAWIKVLKDRVRRFLHIDIIFKKKEKLITLIWSLYILCMYQINNFMCYKDVEIVCVN